MPTIKAQTISLRNIGVLFAAIGGAATLVMGSIRFIQGTADLRYASRDSLVAYQQGQARRDTIAAILHIYELRDIHAELARIDTSVKCLRIKNQHLPMCVQ